MKIDSILACEEYQIFDRKSINISATTLSDTICAFANADGGMIAIGISDKMRRIEGVDHSIVKINDLLRAPIDYCNPSVPVETELVECTNYQGKKDHVLLMKIEASPLLHANYADEVYLRIGDKNKRLSFQDRLTLMYAKGLRYFEDEPVFGATLDDIDMDFVQKYIHKIGYGKTAEEYLLQNKKFAERRQDQTVVSTSAILLFGKYPQQFFPRARVRFIRYDGIEAKVGRDMNVIKDIIFEGRLLDQVISAVDYIKTQMKEKTYLGHDGIFVTDNEYSEFVRTELVVNAVIHRDYGIKGTDIQIKMFDDRLEIDSPGTLAGMVKKDNIRYTHFSRNPKIAAFLKDFNYVKEYGEGIDRMCRELESIGLPAPIFDNSTFILKTTVMSATYKTLPIKKKENEFSSKNLAVEQRESGDSGKNLAIEQRESGDSGKNLAIEQRESGDSSIDSMIEKLSISQLLAQCKKNHYSKVMISKIELIYNYIETNQIFYTTYISKILSCANSTARSLIMKLRQMDVVVAIKGKGKGMYRFKYKDEI